VTLTMVFSMHVVVHIFSPTVFPSARGKFMGRSHDKTYTQEVETRRVTFTVYQTNICGIRL
jgi:hypothetical protein